MHKNSENCSFCKIFKNAKTPKERAEIDKELKKLKLKRENDETINKMKQILTKHKIEIPYLRSRTITHIENKLCIFNFGELSKDEEDKLHKDLEEYEYLEAKLRRQCEQFYKMQEEEKK
jgi:hypothetical protein